MNITVPFICKLKKEHHDFTKTTKMLEKWSMLLHIVDLQQVFDK